MLARRFLVYQPSQDSLFNAFALTMQSNCFDCMSECKTQRKKKGDNENENF